MRQFVAKNSWLPSILVGGLAGFATLIAILILRQPHDAVVLHFDEEARADLQPVWIEGAVNQPGIYLVSSQATLAEAIEHAGGATDQANMSLLDVAEPLGDRAQLSIPTKNTNSTEAGHRIDINSANVEELDELPGIGPVLAERIVNYRIENGAFSRPADLADVSGISIRMVREFEDQISLSE